MDNNIITADQCADCGNMPPTVSVWLSVEMAPGATGSFPKVHVFAMMIAQMPMPGIMPAIFQNAGFRDMLQTGVQSVWSYRIREGDEGGSNSPAARSIRLMSNERMILAVR